MTTKRLAAAIFAAALSLGATADAAFQLPVVGPQSAAMGGSSLSPTPQSPALFSNPGQLAGLERSDFYFMYDQLYAGLQGVGPIGQGFVSAAVPTRLGTFGLGFATFRAAGLLEERTLALTYSRKLSDRIDVGITGKQLHHGYLIGGDPLAAADPVFKNGSSNTGYAVDLGLVGHVSEALTVGLAARNINQPNMGLATVDRVPAEYQGGLAYKLPHMVTLTADLTYRDNGAGTLRDHLTPAIGIEKGLEGGRFVFRGGLTPDSFSAGFGLRLGAIGLDYALVLNRNLIQGSVGTHQLGLSIHFGGSSRVAASRDAEPVASASAQPSAPEIAPAVAPAPPPVAQPVAAPSVAPAVAPAGPPPAQDGMR